MVLLLRQYEDIWLVLLLPSSDSAILPLKLLLTLTVLTFSSQTHIHLK